MARVILEAAGEDVTVGGSDVDVIGTVAPDEVITVTGGSVTLDASFNQGGDTIVLPGAASEYTAFVVNGRLVVTNGTTTLNMPVGANATTLRFDDGDERDVVVVDGELFVGEQPVDSEGETDLEPGENEAPTTIASALGVVLAAEQNEDATLEAIASEVNSQEATPLTGALRQDFIDNFEAGDIEAELQEAEFETLTAESNLNTAEAALASARATNTDAELQEDFEEALDDANDNPLTQEDLAERAEARADLQSDEAESGTNAQLLSDLEDAILAYGAAGGDLTEFVNSVAPSVTLADLLDELNDVLATPDAGDDATLISEIADYDSTDDFGSTPTGNALEDQFDEVDERDALEDTVDVRESALATGTSEGAALVAAEDALGTRQGEINAVNLAQQKLDAAEADEAALQAAVEDYNAAVEASEAANANVDDLGFGEPVILDGDTEFATSGNDVYVFTGEGDSRIVGFGNDGNDVLFYGTEYTVVEIDSDVDIANEDVGDQSVLEVFVQQIRGNTVLTFEDEAFSGSEVDGTLDADTVTLVAFDADDLNENSDGFVSAGMDDTSSMLVVSESFA